MRAAPPVELRTIIDRTRHLLLDFDGPICNLFAGLPALSVATQLQELLRSDGTPLPDHVASEDDPIEVLRFTSSLDLHTAALVDTALRDAELAATATATPRQSATRSTNLPTSAWCSKHRCRSGSTTSPPCSSSMS